MKNLLTVSNWKNAILLCVGLVVVATAAFITNAAKSRGTQAAMSEVAAQGPTLSPIADAIADKLIQKYQQATCADLKKPKTPPSGRQAAIQQQVVDQLSKDPDMRKAFLDKVGPPILDKMFKCGIIP